MFIDNHMFRIYNCKLMDYPLLSSIIRLFTSGNNGIKTLIAFLVTMVCCFTINIFCYVIIPSMPYTAASDYINCLNLKDYDKAAMYYVNIPDGVMVNKERINAAIKGVYENASHVSISSISPSEKPGIYEVKLQLTHEGYSVGDNFLLYNWKTDFFGLEKEWRILFPFKTQDVSVNGIDGSIIFVDGINAGIVQSGKLDICKVICGKHNFKAEMTNMAESEDMVAEVNEYGTTLTLDLKAVDGFKENMEKLVNGFCSGWSDYCMSRDPKNIKPYLTDRLYYEYINDAEMFKGSRYEKSDYTADFKDIAIKGSDSIAFNVDEKWHTREAITDSNLMFKVNRKAVLEQVQYISWSYHIIYESDSWKIDSVEQISFKQDIME